mgnify:CR=1 FL=1
MRFFSTIIALCFTLSLSAQIVVEPATPAPTMEQTEQAQARQPPQPQLKQRLARLMMVVISQKNKLFQAVRQP